MIYKHYKTKGIYRIITENAINEPDLKRMVVYLDIITDKVWIRSYEDFHFIFEDGTKRFVLINDR